MFRCCFKRKPIYERIKNILTWQNVEFRENTLNGYYFLQIYDKKYQMVAIVYFENNFETVIITKYFKIDFLKIYKNLYFDEHGIIKNDIPYYILDYEDRTDSHIYSQMMSFILKS